MKNKFLILLGLLLLNNLSFSQLNKIVDFNSSAVGKTSRYGVKACGDFVFGTATKGGTSGYGVVYKLSKAGSGYTIIHSFDSIHGAYPFGNISVKNDYIFGVTDKGGTNNCGVVYKIKNDGTGFEVILNNPLNYQIDNFIIVDSVLYGSCNHYSPTKIVKVKINGTGYSELGTYSIDANGVSHDLDFIKDSFIYGTAWGGVNANGVIFKIKVNGTGYTKLLDMDRYKTGSYPRDLFLLDNNIYGIANQGGANNFGAIFRLDLNGNNDTIVLNGKSSDYEYLHNVMPYNDEMFCTTEHGVLFRVSKKGKEMKVIFKHKPINDSTFCYPSIIDSSLFSTIYSPSSTFNDFLIKYDIKRLTISKDSLSIDGSANRNGTFNISSNVSWVISSNQPWLTTSSTSGSNNSTITLIALANPTIAPRKAILTITGNGVYDKFFKVIQAGAIPTLTVSSNALTIAKPANSTKAFDIISNIGWTVVSNQDWLTINRASGTGNATVILSASLTINPRTAIVTVSGTDVASQTITVTQDNITSVNTDLEEKHFEIYPNPASSVLYLGYKAEKVLISIFDLNGKMVLRKFIDDNQINISDFHNGVYIIKIEDTSGALIQKNVFIKMQ